MLTEVDIMASYGYEDYNTIIENAEELYPEEESTPSAAEDYWDNYYHNITEELVDE